MQKTAHVLKALKNEIASTSFFDENNVDQHKLARVIILSQAPLYIKATNFWNRLDAAFSFDAGAKYESNIAKAEDKIFQSSDVTEGLMWCYRYLIKTQPDRITGKMIKQMVKAAVDGGTSEKAKLGIHNLYMYANIDMYNKNWHDKLTRTDRQNMSADELNWQHKNQFEYAYNIEQATRSLLKRASNRDICYNNNSHLHNNFHTSLAAVLNSSGAKHLWLSIFRLSSDEFNDVTKNFFNTEPLDKSLPWNNIKALRRLGSKTEGHVCQNEFIHHKMIQRLTKGAIHSSLRNATAARECVLYLAQTSCCVTADLAAHTGISEMNENFMPKSLHADNSLNLLTGLLKGMRACDIDEKMVKDVTYFTVQRALALPQKDLARKSKRSWLLSPLTTMIAKNPESTSIILQEILAPMNGRPIPLQDNLNVILEYVLYKHDQYVAPTETRHSAIFNVARTQVEKFKEHKKKARAFNRIKVKQDAFHTAFNDAASSSDQNKWDELRKSASKATFGVSSETVEAMVEQVANGSFANFANTLGVIANTIQHCVNAPDNPTTAFCNQAIKLMRQASHDDGTRTPFGVVVTAQKARRYDLAFKTIQKRFLKTLAMKTFEA